VTGRARVNGRDAAAPEDGRSLLTWLRVDLRLRGVKEGCGTGHCGACTVIMDDRPRLGCCTLAASADGAEIITIEGLAALPGGQRLIRHFAEADVFQCGYCAPGMILTLWALLSARDDAEPLTDDQVRSWLAASVCRCTGYAGIVAAAIGYAELDRCGNKSD
jgi:aerobic-type carbon monoxide dehydrogenase small subunit (CoxS/CutS family)